MLNPLHKAVQIKFSQTLTFVCCIAIYFLLLAFASGRLLHVRLRATDCEKPSADVVRRLARARARDARRFTVVRRSRWILGKVARGAVEPSNRQATAGAS